MKSINEKNEKMTKNAYAMKVKLVVLWDIGRPLFLQTVTSNVSCSLSRLVWEPEKGEMFIEHILAPQK